MVSSVSSKRAFSQGGITIGKHCSQLKGVIVEALQYVKCGLQHHLIFCEPAPASALEMELDDGGELPDKDVKVPEDVEDGSWDALMLDEDDKDFAIEVDSDN